MVVIQVPVVRPAVIVLSLWLIGRIIRSIQVIVDTEGGELRRLKVHLIGRKV